MATGISPVQMWRPAHQPERPDQADDVDGERGQRPGDLAAQRAVGVGTAGQGDQRDHRQGQHRRDERHTHRQAVRCQGVDGERVRDDRGVLVAPRDPASGG